MHDRWNPDTERFPQRASDESRDDRPDASTFALANAATEYAALLDERRQATDGGTAAAAVDFDAFLDHVTTHVLTTIGDLRRETADVEGLVRFRGDDWRTAEQGAAKVWSIATLWGSTAAAELGGLVRERDGDAADLFGAARDLYALCEPDGPFVNDAGLIAEQAFDDGDLDGATPIAWSHALRIDATVTLASHGALPVPHDEPRGRTRHPTGRPAGSSASARRPTTRSPTRCRSGSR